MVTTGINFLDMKKLFFILNVCSFLTYYTASAQGDYSFKLDIPIDSAGLNKYEYIGDQGIFTGPSSHVKGREYKMHGVKVTIGMNKISDIVCYLSCDSNFIINNVRYLSLEKGYLDSLKKNCKLFVEAGYVAYILIDDGWKLNFNYLDVIKSEKKGYFLKEGAKPTCVSKTSNKVDEGKRLKGKVAGVQVRN